MFNVSWILGLMATVLAPSALAVFLVDRRGGRPLLEVCRRCCRLYQETDLSRCLRIPWQIDKENRQGVQAYHLG